MEIHEDSGAGMPGQRRQVVSCPVCGYTGDGAKTSRCPSCGTDVSLLLQFRAFRAGAFDRAIECARSGDFEDALLYGSAALSTCSADPQGWVFLGRLRWNAGDTHGAKHAWERALAIDPHCREAEGLLQEMPLPPSGPASPSRSYLHRLSFGIIVLVAVFAAGIGTGMIRSVTSNPPSPSENGTGVVEAGLSSVTSPDPGRLETQDKVERIGIAGTPAPASALAAIGGALVPEEAAALAALERVIAALPGAKTEFRGNQIRAWFTEPLFAPGSARLNGPGEEGIVAIAQTLSETDVLPRLRITGLTDATPIAQSRWRDNPVLALHRAVAAAELIHQCQQGRENPSEIEIAGFSPEHGAIAEGTSERGVLIEIMVAPPRTSGALSH